MPSEAMKRIMIAKMRENPIVFDKHENKDRALLGLVEFNSPGSDLACYIDKPFCLLKACELDADDDRLYCNSSVVGGYLYSRLPNADELKDYNNSIIKGRNINKIKCVHLPDGNVIYPA